jgi:hypothetical protein
MFIHKKQQEALDSHVKALIKKNKAKIMFWKMWNW